MRRLLAVDMIEIKTKAKRYYYCRLYMEKSTGAGIRVVKCESWTAEVRANA